MQSSKLGMWKGKRLDLAAEPSRIKLSWVPTGLVIVVYRGSTQHDDRIEECRGGKTTRETAECHLLTKSLRAPLQSAVTSTSVVKGWQLESGGIISQGTGANIAAVTTTAWAWEKREQMSDQIWRNVNMGKNGFQGTFHLLELAGQTSTSCKENSTINHDYSTGFVYT